MPIFLRKTYSVISALLKEPLLQFLLIGALIFIAAEISANWKDHRQHVIVIDNNLKNHLKNLYNVQFGVNPDDETLDQLVDNYIREEVMYREALRMGLADQDEIIRRRLVQKMEFLLTDSSDITNPGETVLTTYYKKHAAEFSNPAMVSFRHLYFSNDNVREPGAWQRSMDALLAIRSGREQQARQSADMSPLNDHYADLNRRDAQQLFGQTEFVQRLFETPMGQWSGPFQSGYGWHLVLVLDRVDEKFPPFADVADRVFSAWRDENREQHFESVLKTMLGNYEIQRVGDSGPG